MAISQQKGSSFENVIQKIYLLISMKERIKATVDRDVTLIGRDGSSNQFDVIYEYEHLGSIFKVAIECKNWKNPVNVASLRDFQYKLGIVGGLNGIFISKDSYFQDGAKKVSEYNGIRIMKFEDFNIFISNENEEYLKPTQDTIGEPFWTIMNCNGKNLNEQLIANDEILLFESESFAHQFYATYFLSDSTKKVVGLSQAHLKEVIKMLSNENNLMVKIFNPYTSDIRISEYHFTENINIDDLNWFVRD